MANTVLMKHLAQHKFLCQSGQLSLLGKLLEKRIKDRWLDSGQEAGSLFIVESSSALDKSR